MTNSIKINFRLPFFIRHIGKELHSLITVAGRAWESRHCPAQLRGCLSAVTSGRQLAILTKCTSPLTQVILDKIIHCSITL